MNFYNKWVFFCSLLIFTACCDDDKLTNFEFPNCSFDFEPKDNTSDQCFNHVLDSLAFCELIDVDEYFYLPITHREWMPYHCLSVGSQIPYINSKNEETFLIVQKLDKGIYSGRFNGFDDCDLNDDRHRIYCINREVMTAVLSSDLLGHSLSLILEVEFNRPFELPPKTGAILNINGNNISHFTAFVETNELENIQAGNLIFEEEFNILGESFMNVHTFENVVHDSFVQIYYNKEYGIIGFIDYAGELWKIKI